MNISSIFYISKPTSINTPDTVQWSIMGHSQSRDDVVHKRPHKNEIALAESAEKFGIGLFYSCLEFDTKW